MFRNSKKNKEKEKSTISLSKKISLCVRPPCRFRTGKNINYDLTAATNDLSVARQGISRFRILPEGIFPAMSDDLRDALACLCHHVYSNGLTAQHDLPVILKMIIYA